MSETDELTKKCSFLKRYNLVPSMLCETGSQRIIYALLFMSFSLCVLVKEQQSITMIHVNNNVKLLNDLKHYN